MIDVIFQDNHVIVVNKPAGMLTQGDSTSRPDLLSEVKAYIKRKYNKPGKVFAGLVHRLDKPVSGVIVFARTSKAAARLSKAFRERGVEKVYVAAVEGRCVGSGRLENYLRRKDSQSVIVKRDEQGAKRAILHWETHRILGQCSYLAIRPITGRHHQIRAQLSKIEHPIVGDTQYGSGRKLPGGNIALHSTILRFPHPTLPTEITVSCPPPNYQGVEWEEMASEMIASYSVGTE